MSTSIYTGLNPCVTVCHHSSTGLYRSLSAQRLSERIEELRHEDFNPFNAELNPICHLLALIGAHHILHVSRIRIKCV